MSRTERCGEHRKNKPSLAIWPVVTEIVSNCGMYIPTIKGLIKRRLLVNFRADPTVVQALLPPPFRPKLHRGHAMVGVCLLRLEQIRPAGLPGFVGFNSENAAHRIAVEWMDEFNRVCQGVFVPRRDTDSRLNQFAGGRVFPGAYEPAQFQIEDDGRRICFQMQSLDRQVRIELEGAAADTLPAGSCFDSLAAASAYFEGGSLGYSVTPQAGRLDGMRLHTPEWRVAPLDVFKVHSSYFADPRQFPEGSVIFDHALIMRDVRHEWQRTASLPVPVQTNHPAL